MKQDELMGLLQKFSPKVFQHTLESLRTAYHADASNPVRNVFQALEAALSAPGVTQLEPVEIPAGQTSSNGWTVPASPDQTAGGWPVRIAEISGGGAPYLEEEQIRTNVFVVPLKLNTPMPQFEGAALAVALLHACGAATKQTGRLPQRNQRFVFTACDESLEVFLERRNFETKVELQKKIRAKDGTWVQSDGERLICEALDSANIKYRYDERFRILDGYAIRPDFYLPELDVYLEYWGLDTPQYKMSMYKKQTLYQQEGKRLISVYPQDLPALDRLLAAKLHHYGFVP